MSKEKQDLMKKEMVKEVLENQIAMNSLTVDKIAELAPEPTPAELRLTAIQKAKAEGAIYIEPRKKLQAVGKLPEKYIKMHAHDWEYVVGIFQPETVGGVALTENFTFWFRKWPGDADCQWEIPVNRAVYVPRMIAQHLSGEKESFTGIETMKYHQFGMIEKATHEWRKDDFTHSFAPTGTQYRGQFMPLRKFA